jgi:hypothetical protein
MNHNHASETKEINQIMLNKILIESKQGDTFEDILNDFTKNNDSNILFNKKIKNMKDDFTRQKTQMLYGNITPEKKRYSFNFLKNTF